MMNNQTHTTRGTGAGSVLPQDTSQALNMLIRLTNNLSNLADREATALAQADMVTFAILQDEKTLVTEQYIAACEDFRSNVNSYRGAEWSTLVRLERLQRELGEKTRSNNDVVQQLYERARNRTQSSLLTAQELGQDQRVRFESAVNENENKTSSGKTGGV
jgi:hypothetical protein